MQPVSISHAAVPDTAAWAPAAVDAPADAALHTATLQAAARPQASLAPEAPRPLDAALPVADVANGFALPADQLLPVTLIGLQVQAGDAWPMAAQSGELRWPRRDADDEDTRRPATPATADDDPVGDPEPTAGISGYPAHLGDRAIDRVVADDLTIPAMADQVFTSQDAALGLDQGDQHLHDARLDGGFTIGSFDSAYRRAHNCVFQPKVGSLGE